MNVRLLFIVLFFLTPNLLFAQYSEGVFIEAGAGTRTNLGNRKGNFEGFSIPFSINYLGSKGWYGGLLLQGGKVKTTPSKFSNRTFEKFDQWQLGMQAGKLIPLNNFISADINAGFSLMYTDGVAFADDMAYLFDQEEAFANNEDAFEQAYINGLTSISLLFSPHHQSPVYFKAGGYLNINSFATSKGLLFSIGLRL